MADVVTCYKRKSSLKGLPGTGQKSAHCDGWFAPKFCSECGEIAWRKGNCKRALCPDCSTAWRFDRAESMVKRLYSFKLEKGKRLRHFAVSPPNYLVEYYEEGEIGIDYLFREVRRTVRWKTEGEDGGGVIIYHPYRLTKEGKKKAEAIKSEKEDMAPGECGDWKAILTLDDWGDYCYFSPHFHVVVEIDKGKNWKEGNEKFDGGWIWEGIREVKDGRDVLKLSMYLLSHAGILEDKNGIRWFGDVSTNNWSFDEASDWVRDKVKSDFRVYVEEYEKAENFSVKTCSKCGGELVDFGEVLECLVNFEGEIRAKLFSAYLLRYSGKDPPKSLETEGEVENWLKSEYEDVFSDESIFDGVSPSDLRRMVSSMPEEVKRNEKLRRKYWIDPQKVIRHFEKSGAPKYYGHDRGEIEI